MFLTNSLVPSGCAPARRQLVSSGFCRHRFRISLLALLLLTVLWENVGARDRALLAGSHSAILLEQQLLLQQQQPQQDRHLQEQQAAQDSSGIPHVSSCRFCHSCSRGQPGEAGAGESHRHGHPINSPALLSPHSFPSVEELEKRASKPTCEVCYGCSHQLGLKQDLGAGLTPAWLFEVATNLTANGTAIVKVHGLPFKHNGQPGKTVYNPAALAEKLARQVAVKRIAEECGLDGVLVKSWVAQVDGVVPGIGFHISWPGLWMERARGVPLERLFSGHGDRTKLRALDIMQHKVKKEQVVAAAIFDLLLNHCDRTTRNLFISEEGDIQLIDNEDVMGAAYQPLNSVLLPSTRYYEAARFGVSFMNRARPGWNTRDILTMLLDYRCHLGQNLGLAYPEKAAQCLQAIAANSTEQVQQHFGLPTHRDAVALHTRASDMFNKGFEWALKFGAPEKPAEQQFPLQPPCCSFIWDSAAHTYACNTTWNLNLHYLDPEGPPAQDAAVPKK